MISQNKTITGLFTLILLVASNNLLANSTQEYQVALQSWAKVLEEFVDAQGRIDFQSIQANPDDLNAVIKIIETYGPDSHPQDFTDTQTLLAYHINTYNALAMYGVIERGIPKGFTSLFKRASFFLLRDVIIAGKKTNLYNYENKVIRPLNEPRLHFALNCMVRDCPRLLQKPYTAENLEEELQSASLEFFSKPLHFRLDHNKNRIYVSSILDFYTKDFVASGRKQDLPMYIDQFLTEPLPDGYKVRYINYDWRINIQP